MEVTGKLKLSIQNNKLAPHLKKRIGCYTDEQYPQYAMSFTQDKCDLLNNIMLVKT
jgi:hypothetical protein